MARYYVLSIEPSLFGDATLIREWGRLGRPGQRWVELYENQSCAMEALEIWLQRKRRRGYLLQSGLGRSTAGLGLDSAQDLEQFFDGLSLLEAASLVLAQHVPDLGAL
ncbi:hypothetical protein MAE02_68590 [Microvirga aerophila]|uniref:WGR domain-containing protein n=2 Tax=Microvirga aerophila TaxID=670291 RepID=A0A512C4L3_9HYPH|nr:hypothetical protein MAE02_68590 [Microvirga aerophila]